MTPQLLTKLQQTLDMFIFLAIEITILFLLISYLIGIVLEFVPPERIRRTLSAPGGSSYLAAVGLGVITPFCSCSTIPMLTGLLKARAGFGPTLTFLFTSPLLNPVILGLFAATFSIAIAITYAAIALGVALFAGWLLETLGFEKEVRTEILSVSRPARSSSDTGYGHTDNRCCTPSESPQIKVCCDETANLSVTSVNRWLRIWQDTWRQFVSVAHFVAIGVIVGSFTYGFMPADLVAQYAGTDTPLAIPIAAVIGVPLYISAEAMIPLSAALSEKGMALGAIMALIIGSAGASLTEVILLRSIFKARMVIAFLVVIFGMAMVSGFLFNNLF